jgi:hypothetical protein
MIRQWPPHSSLGYLTPEEFARKSAPLGGGNDAGRARLENAARFPHFPQPRLLRLRWFDFAVRFARKLGGRSASRRRLRNGGRPRGVCTRRPNEDHVYLGSGRMVKQPFLVLKAKDVHPPACAITRIPIAGWMHRLERLVFEPFETGIRRSKVNKPIPFFNEKAMHEVRPT